MKKSKKINLIVLLILLFISFILLFCDLLFRDKNNTYQISVILSGKSDESFMILKEGAEQAALEMNANIRFLFLSKDNNEEEQIELIKRESQNEVDALLINPIESKNVIDAVKYARNKIPVILIQSFMEIKGGINRVMCDEYQLGKSLAEEALNNISKNQNIMIITSDNKSTSYSERYNGVLDVLNESNHKYVISNIENYVDYTFFNRVLDSRNINISKNQNIMIITSDNKSTSYSERYNGVLDVLNESNHKYVISNIENYVDYTFFNRVLDSRNIGAIVCMDRDITEEIAELKKKSINENYNKDVLIFGVGNTNKIISLLEEEVVNATAVQNEFNIGYIAVKNAIELKDGKKVEESKAIKSTVISSEDMYSPKNERILFQFVR